MLNPAYAAMHGYSSDELKGAPIVSLYAPEERAAVAQHIRTAHEQGHYMFEAIHMRKDGTRFPALIGLTTVKDGQGQVLYRVSNTVDLTERKRQEGATACTRGSPERNGSNHLRARAHRTRPARWRCPGARLRSLQAALSERPIGGGQDRTGPRPASPSSSTLRAMPMPTCARPFPGCAFRQCSILA